MGSFVYIGSATDRYKLRRFHCDGVFKIDVALKKIQPAIFSRTSCHSGLRWHLLQLSVLFTTSGALSAYSGTTVTWNQSRIPSGKAGDWPLWAIATPVSPCLGIGLWVLGAGETHNHPHEANDDQRAANCAPNVFVDALISPVNA